MWQGSEEKKMGVIFDIAIRKMYRKKAKPSDEDIDCGMFGKCWRKL